MMTNSYIKIKSFLSTVERVEGFFNAYNYVGFMYKEILLQNRRFMIKYIHV